MRDESLRVLHLSFLGDRTGKRERVVNGWIRSFYDVLHPSFSAANN